jgi:hypothetical protein
MIQLDEFKDIIAAAGYAIESAGVLVIIVGFVLASAKFLWIMKLCGPGV